MDQAYENYDNGLGLKRKIIPEAWKTNLDDILMNDLMGANRYFAEVNPEIVQLVSRVAQMQPPSFYRELVNRWNWHNHFYECLLEPAIPQLIGRTALDVSARQVELIGEVYEVASLVDQATLVTSIAIKPCVENWLNGPGQKLKLEEKHLLLTPPDDPFCVSYLREHLDYLIARHENTEVAEEIKLRLMEEYHANDKAIFEGRLHAKFGQYLSMTLDELHRARKTLNRADNSTSHFYLTIERPALKAVRDLLVFDNFHEYKLVTSLIGISGFILRKNVLSLLESSKILKSNQGIYEHSDVTVLESLRKLRGYREELLSREVRPYKQRGVTCSAVCLMMAMHYLDYAELSQAIEYNFHSRSNSAHIEGEHFAGLAKIAAEAGLETILVHSEGEMFTNERRLFASELYSSLLAEYRAYLESSRQPIVVQNGVVIDSELIRNLLNQDYLVLIAGKLGQVLHAVLAVGFNKQGLVVIDPLIGKKEVYEPGWLNTFTRTDIGRWILAVRRNQTPARMLMESLSRTRKEANFHLRK